MFERILVPLDGSLMAESILAQVRRILYRRDAEVLLLRAFAMTASIEGDFAGLREDMERQAEAYLRGQELKLAEKGVRVRSLTRYGGAAESILAAAAAEKATLIGMTTHGRTGMSRWAFGSVAEKVLRAGPTPVLLTRSFLPDPAGALNPVAPGEITVRKILVPIDLSEISLEVLPYAEELAQLFEAKVLLLNVCGETATCDVPVVPMNRAHEYFRKAGLSVEPLMRQGDPAVQILEACREQGADFIAMTTHGRSGVSRWALGSVAEKVMRNATVPLLAVRGATAGREGELAASGVRGRDLPSPQETP